MEQIKRYRLQSEMSQFYQGEYVKHADHLAQVKALRDALGSLLEATPQEQCSEDCDEECCPWMQARAALAATKEGTNVDR
jgi:CHAD domain-containing protein